MQLGYRNPKIRFGLHPLAPERDPIWVSWSLGSGARVPCPRGIPIRVRKSCSIDQTIGSNQSFNHRGKTLLEYELPPFVKFSQITHATPVLF